MAYTKTWKIVNTANPTRVHTSVADFYSQCQNPDSTDADVKQHLSNDAFYNVIRTAEVSEDGTYITHVKTFADEDTHDAWKSAGASLPTIDKDLTITEV